ncbi:ABC transporter ATP-binding protein [Roseovarius atlanticus]|uniref:ABC transporter ATP-binding protein n=1 Tax=Roseovarius atlanticus TaxID=1641875 RepID=UPI001C95AAE0|nr:ATP-binding cassette domain-containing protein [Roseovarius atlanticus]MBY5989964.1 ATP-binding cassette domain-containing protein [Roseovarius atlanticus]MBY6126509.1 ATP-binding cassette domain-containing protein [Roseovarius atlanticus]MBY6151003.1 ATP-binding cassette domain-containing protein [Roseovarius atlanticus]
MTHVLSIEGVRAAYGKVTVLHGIDLYMAPGENIGLFGPNGHGKTTLLRVISGLMAPSAGKVVFEGEDITRERPPVIVTKGLVQSQQGNTLFGDMGVAETLEMAAFTRPARARAKQSLEQVYDLFPRLAERGPQTAKTLSGGERQMLSIGASLMCAPRLLLLDEPTLGLSPKLKEELAVALKEISVSVPVIVVEQDVELLLSLADRLYLIEHGEVEREIGQENALDHQEIMEMYFGEQSA